MKNIIISGMNTVNSSSDSLSNENSSESQVTVSEMNSQERVKNV